MKIKLALLLLLNALLMGNTFSQVPKVAWFFSSWPQNAPMARIGAATTYDSMQMSKNPQRCGWFKTDFIAQPFTVLFKSVFGTQTYGLGGLGSLQNIDLTTPFLTSDTIYIVPDPAPGGPPRILTSFPTGTVGICSFPLAVTVRDFHSNHPDFEENFTSYSKGMVLPTLDTASKPVKNPATTALFMTDFSNWFRDKSSSSDPLLNNHAKCVDIPMSRSNGGMWGFDAYTADTSKGFFPIDSFNLFPGVAERSGNQYIDRATNSIQPLEPTGQHNFHFCAEIHAQFKYLTGQKFKFIGDDDTWAFIDKKLVMDLGGPHGPLSGSVNLDTIKPALVSGQEYPFDFFICERKTTGSNLLIETSIYFEQKSTVFMVSVRLPDGSIRYDFFEIRSGSGACGSTHAGDTIVAASTFKLSGPSLPVAQVLPPGSIYYGGINIPTSGISVIIDTTKITGLKPGLYTLVWTAGNGQGGVIQFRVPGINTLEFVPKNPVNVPVGTSVPIIIKTLLSGQPDPRVEDFRLTPQTNLLLYLDSALTQPIVLGTTLTTDATGTKKVWTTSQIAGTYQLFLYAGPTFAVLMDTYNNLTFVKILKVATPIAIPPGGTTFSSLSTGVSVTLSTITAGATICYTLTGVDPDSLCSNAITYTGAIPITQTTTLKARAILTGMIASDILVATYTKVDPGRVATPVAVPPGRTFVFPLSVALSTSTSGATICYTINGTAPDSTCSNATSYTGSINIAVTTTLQARAIKAGLYPSDILTEIYTYLPPINITKAWYHDQNGDGRIESVFLDFDKALGQLPDSLSFAVTGHGGRTTKVTATKTRGEISGNANHVLVKLSTPLTFGITSVTNGPTSGQKYRQDNIPLVVGSFPVEDSLPPVLFSGEVLARNTTNLLKRVILTYSEPVSFPLTSQAAVIFKRDATEVASAQVRIDHIVKLNDLQYEFHVAAISTFFPIVGDSVAIGLGTETLDLLGNSPSIKFFQVLGGIVPPPESAKLYVTFASGTMDPYLTGTLPLASDRALFIPVNRYGKAIPGTTEGKCGSCDAGPEGAFVGSVIHMEIPGATGYEFKIFSTLGEFMAEGKGKITESDLLTLETVPGSEKFHARIIWNGKTHKQDMAGMGAYILVAKLAIDKDLKTGAPATQQSKKILFGYLRGK